MKRIRMFQRFMISLMIGINLLFYFLKKGESPILALIISGAIGMLIYFSLTFVRLNKRKQIRLLEAKK